MSAAFDGPFVERRWDAMLQVFTERPSEKAGSSHYLRPLAPKTTNFKKARGRFYEIGRLFCTPIHSKMFTFSTLIFGGKRVEICGV